MIIRLKSPAEIERFSEAGFIAGKILRVLMDAVKPGVTTGELDELARQECEKANVKPVFLGYRGFPGAVCVSVNEEVVHGIPGPRVLNEDDIVSLDVGVDLDGFIGDTADTMVVGNKPAKLIQACQYALDAAISAAKPGKRLADVCEEIARCAKSEGFGIVTNLGGHGIDRNVLHADPFVWNRPIYGFDEDVELAPGMVFAIEPMFVEGHGDTKLLSDGWTVVADGPAAHCEHTIAITERGNNVLTRPLAPYIPSPLFDNTSLNV